MKPRGRSASSASRASASTRQPRHAICVCAGSPVVAHDEDNDWVFACGTTGEPVHVQVACLGCLVEADPRLAELADLPTGWLAYRIDPAADWERGPLPDDDSGDGLFVL